MHVRGPGGSAGKSPDLASGGHVQNSRPRTVRGLSWVHVGLEALGTARLSVEGHSYFWAGLVARSSPGTPKELAPEGKPERDTQQKAHAAIFLEVLRSPGTLLVACHPLAPPFPKGTRLCVNDKLPSGTFRLLIVLALGQHSSRPSPRMTDWQVARKATQSPGAQTGTPHLPRSSDTDPGISGSQRSQHRACMCSLHSGATNFPSVTQELG